MRWRALACRSACPGRFSRPSRSPAPAHARFGRPGALTQHQPVITHSSLLAPLCPVGILAHLDGYMNIAMEQTEEYQNGVLKAKYGDAFIRGNNGAR